MTRPHVAIQRSRLLRQLSSALDKRKAKRHLGRVVRKLGANGRRGPYGGRVLLDVGVGGAFIWGDSPQGFDFWHRVARQVDAGAWL